MQTLANAAAQLKRCARHSVDGALPALWLLTDEHRLPNPAPALAHLPRGSGVILRHYGDPTRHALAQRLVTVCRRRGLVFLVAADWRLAAKVGAAGIHMPEHAVRSGPAPGARLWLRSGPRLLTMAAHGESALRHAGVQRAAAAFLAPVFPTRSHPDRPTLGARRFGQFARQARVPVFALGGIDPRTVARLRHSGAAGIAGIGFAVR